MIARDEGQQPLPLTVSTFPLVHAIEAADAMRRLATLGYRRFEVACAPGHLWPSETSTETRRALRAEWQRESIQLVGLNPSSLDQNLAGAAPETRQHTLRILDAVFHLAADLGVPFVVVPAGRVNPLLPPPRQRARDWLRLGVRDGARLAAAAGVRMLLENLPFGALPLAEDLVAFVDELNDPSVGIAYDVANATFVGERPDFGIRTIDARLELVHLSDTGLNAWRHDPIGRGVVPFDRIGAALRRVDFRGPSVLEARTAVPERELLMSQRALAEFGWESTEAEGALVNERTQTPA